MVTTFYQTGLNGLFIFYQVFNLILQSANLKNTLMVIICIDIIMIIVNYFNKNMQLGLLLIGSMYGLMLLLYSSILLKYLYDTIYKTIYVVKYARQFQCDWKIPDEEW